MRRRHISLVNIDAHKSQEISITLNGSKFKNVTGRILVSEKMTDHNAFEAPANVQPEAFKDAKFENGVLKVNLPPVSVVVLELK